MKKNLLLILFLSVTFLVNAQESEKEVIKKTADAAKIIEDTIPNGWRSDGKLTLLLNQASFSNWTAGGEDSFSGNLGIDYKLNYR